MAKKTRKRTNAGNAAGRRLMESLRGLHDAIMSGDHSKLTMRTVEIPEPAPYGPKEIRALRQRLGVSQGIFAHLVAVSPVLVAQWESGIRKPAGVVCRLLDKINDNPAEYLASLIHRKSA
jgi:putative transcriptional regulator